MGGRRRGIGRNRRSRVVVVVGKGRGRIGRNRRSRVVVVVVHSILSL